MQDNWAYRDPVREEVIGGKPVAMSPRPSVNHNWISDNITYIFKNYLRGKKCVPFSDGVDLHLSEKDIFIPDMMVVCDRSKIKPDGVYGAPDWMLERMSDTERDSLAMEFKCHLYDDLVIRLEDIFGGMF